MNSLILDVEKDDSDGNDEVYPLCLIETDGLSLLERLVRFCSVSSDVTFIFAVRKCEVQQLHLNSVVSQLASPSHIFNIEENRGAACSALLAARWIDNDQELLIVCANAFLEADMQMIIKQFRDQLLDVGIITFPSSHLRHPYARFDPDGFVMETTANDPISRHAIAGVYWFAHGSDFVRATQNMIRKDHQVDGLFCIAPVINELVLANKRIGSVEIGAEKYHAVPTPCQLDRSETGPRRKKIN